MSKAKVYLQVGPPEVHVELRPYGVVFVNLEGEIIGVAKEGTDGGVEIEMGGPMWVRLPVVPEVEE